MAKAISKPEKSRPKIMKRKKSPPVNEIIVVETTLDPNVDLPKAKEDQPPRVKET